VQGCGAGAGVSDTSDTRDACSDSSSVPGDDVELVHWSLTQHTKVHTGPCCPQDSPTFP
jgi:hypothetical protein